MNKFKVKTNFKPIPEQSKAIDNLVAGIKNNLNHQVLLGVTGSGKTFTVANVIEKLQRPTLIISHNKTLAAQLYQEFKSYFPDNAVSYFVSYYDYYQPESYIPSTDTYIEKDSDINELIDKLRLAATTNLLTRPDTIVVASVSCIYNIGSPKEYGKFIFEISKGVRLERKQIIDRLLDLQYERAEFGFNRGTFRVRGNTIDVYPAYQDEAVRLELDGEFIQNVNIINPVTGEGAENNSESGNFVLYPAKHYITDTKAKMNVFNEIKTDLEKVTDNFLKQGKLLEAQRIKQRVTYDLEMIREMGYVKGIENYSRYFDGRKPGDAPFTLIDYFNEPYGKDWLLIIDESHITFPQIRGMYNGDRSRKQTLIEYGFRLPSAIDNRPLTFEEFMRRVPNFIATSATPSEWELSMAKTSAGKQNGEKLPKDGVTQQLLRPTGIPDPKVTVKPIKNQVSDVIEEIKTTAKKGQRALITALTKKTAEDLSNYLEEKGIKVHYLHSDIDTLERTDILDDLRRGNYDCIVGVNLLREGLDLPEVTLVAILDADKEGFLRSEVSLIQTMGRAARHVEGRVILYADRITGSMERALFEVRRRRKYQEAMNKKYNITPKSISKPFREKLVEYEEESILEDIQIKMDKKLPDIDAESLTPMDKKKVVAYLRTEMRNAAKDLNFELAIELRDKIKGIES
jgi:excinuclease ABC subunit B